MTTINLNRICRNSLGQSTKQFDMVLCVIQRIVLSVVYRNLIRSSHQGTSQEMSLISNWRTIHFLCLHQALFAANFLFLFIYFFTSSQRDAFNNLEMCSYSLKKHLWIQSIVPSPCCLVQQRGALTMKTLLSATLKHVFQFVGEKVSACLSETSIKRVTCLCCFWIQAKLIFW